MTTVVVPFAGFGGKTRLAASASLRRELSVAMLGDVLAAAVEVGTTLVVTPDAGGAEIAHGAGAEPVADPGGGQGAAVAAALAGARAGPVLVVNADLPCATAGDLRRLLAAIPSAGLALVEASDGTTNALGLSSASVFAPVYGPGSAQRFRSLAPAAVAVDLPNLAADVDTLADLERLQRRCGPRTQACLAGTLG
jgi:2-phospho-L-lactate/phosphoenolpyruvate guanylyltransferase